MTIPQYDVLVYGCISGDNDDGAMMFDCCISDDNDDNNTMCLFIVASVVTMTYQLYWLEHILAVVMMTIRRYDVKVAGDDDDGTTMI